MLVGVLPACGTIKSWFPDKERDYQFTSEIPELIVPDDLKNKGLASLSPQSAEPPVSEAESVSGSRYPAEAEAEPTAAEVATTESQAATVISAAETESVKNPDQDESKPVEQPVVAGGVSSLQIDQPKSQAVRMVGRALSRQKLEVVERNIDKGYFYVKFDLHAVKATDESIWDELNFFFGDDPSQEQEYRITVRQIEPQLSQVTIQDSAGVSLSDATANALLKLITDAINEVQTQDANKGPAEAEPKPETEPKLESEPEPKAPDNPAKQE
ncbi:outer membrane protein assembly factor BamC [Methylomonas sp. LL1]|nr:outer membrane protein assembly factor BamC [Methylomonas sp. LL1]